MASRVAAAVQALTKLYPKELADSAWDNTGLLLDCGTLFARSSAQPLRILLTIDLTTSVCDEAIASESDLVVAYHPIIFSGLKSISEKDPQQRSLLRLARHGVSVYSPHTAVDAHPRGVNDLLCGVVTDSGRNELSRQTIQPVRTALTGFSGAGYGQLVHMKQPVPLTELVATIKSRLGLPHVQLVSSDPAQLVRSVAICAGSGSSVLKDVQADCWLTGELSHHTCLYLRETGVSAVLCGHSNTERCYLPTMLRELQAELPDASISISTTDRDPIDIV